MNTFVKRFAATLLLISWLMSGARPSVAQDSPQRAAEPLVPLRSGVEREGLIPRLEGLIPQLMKEGVVPGLSIALIRDSKVVWHRGFGVKNAATKEAVDADTVFEAASLSKPVFAYAVLGLVESGKLNLDTPLNKYLPGPYVENDERLNLITARGVLSHTTGLRNWRPKGGPLKIYFTPGERFSYSGEGFVYLQKVVEHLTGEPLDLFMRKTVFEPLKMTSSSYVWLDKYDTLKATGHDQSGSPTSRRKPSQTNAAASLQTTALDYAKFVAAVLNGAGLRKEMIKEMLGAQIRVDESCTNCTERQPGRLSPSIAWGLGGGWSRPLTASPSGTGAITAMFIAT